MMNNTQRNGTFFLGIYLLETLTAGMYIDPLSMYREYVQNAVDSIDLLSNAARGQINIDLDPTSKSIVIKDNGAGIPSSNAPYILSSIGISSKGGLKQRGFRGIGRLGGLAFAEKAVFRTKAKGEIIETVQTWDCLRLRQLLTDRSKRFGKLDDLYKQVVETEQYNHKRPSGSYFEITLMGVSSFRNHLLDYRRVADYLAEVAPVPFDPTIFSFSERINEFVKEKTNDYRAYSIILNGQPIFKKYMDHVSLTKGGHDSILDFERLFLPDDSQTPLACGWYGVRDHLLGAIHRESGVGGIRVRVGNIQLGDGHLLDQCFKEPRFNGYLTGEIHVISERLIPNGRRDDFVDNETKAMFFNSIERQVGLPLSKEIRRRSRDKLNNIGHEGDVKILPSSDNSLDQPAISRNDDFSKCGGCPNYENIRVLIESLRTVS